jgi:hypothetical protein
MAFCFVYGKVVALEEFLLLMQVVNGGFFGTLIGFIIVETVEVLVLFLL